MHLGLRAKTLLWILTVVTAAIGATAFLLFRGEEEALRQERTLRGSSLAQHTADAARDPLILGDDLALRTMAETVLSREPGVVYVLIEGARSPASEGHSYLASAHPAGAGMLRELQKLDVPPPGAPRARDLDLPGPLNVIDISVPVTVKGGAVGVVRLGLSVEEIHRVVRRSEVKIAAVTIPLLALFLAISFVLVAFAVRPIEYLAHKAREMGEGNLATVIRVERKDEIGRLGEALSSMGRQILENQAQLVENKRLERELEIAREIQELMIPREFPDLPGYSLAAFFRPAQVIGGDFYDVFTLADGRLGCTMADVSGKSISGALVMSFARTILRSEAARGGGPREVLLSANDAIRKDLRPKMFVTVAYLTLEPSTGEVRLASAGHPPAIRYGKGGAAPLPSRGMAVGIAGRDQMGKIMEETKLKLEVGEGIFLYTDGVTEAVNKEREEFGEERCLEVLRERGSGGAQARIDRMGKALDLFSAGAAQADDITMLALERIKAVKASA